MKKLVLLAALFLSLQSYSQVILTGSQKRGVNSNADLYSETVTLTQQSEIYKVDGGNAGFWIVDESGKLVYSFFKPEDAIGKTLTKGKYKVYPNLTGEAKEAKVKLYLKPRAK